ncbi:MAG: NAD-dependent epimerase/dehydratase family protein [Desulfobacterales bacterium]|nr:NAD-dependent epimerase/dehydratase family protein [Desulfobacterales bacterium]
MEYDGITLVTGAAGFMGSHMVECLAAKGCRVRATARPRKDTSFFDRLGVEFVGADLTQPETLPPLFDGDVDRVIHLGAICNFSTPYARLRPTNVMGVAHMADLALGAKVKCFVHVTSTSVYGCYTGSPFTEESLRNPKDDYGRSKRDGEDMLFKRMDQGLAAVIVRPCTVYGSRCNDGAGKAFSRASSIAAIPGSGGQLLSNIRAEDVAAAAVHLSCRKEALGEVYNLADDSHPTLEAALTLAAETFGTKPPGLHLPLFLVRALARVDGFVSGLKGRIPDLEYEAACYLSEDYVVDNTKLKATGFEFAYPDFIASMTQMGQWHRSRKS